MKKLNIAIQNEINSKTNKLCNEEITLNLDLNNIIDQNLFDNCLKFYFNSFAFDELTETIIIINGLIDLEVHNDTGRMKMLLFYLIKEIFRVKLF